MILMLGWLATAFAGVTVSLPASDAEVELDDSAGAAVEQGMQALSAGRFDDAGRAFRALSEAGAGPVAHYLEALAWYEGGRLRGAQTAIDALLAKSPEHGPGLALLGLIQADGGRGDEAMSSLERAARVAGDDRRLKAQITLNRGLILMDQGSLGQAQKSFETSASVATEVGDEATLRVARENLATLAALTGAGGQGGDAISTVVARLRTGDVAGARKSVPKPSKSDRRGAVRALLADALVDRAEGAFDAANVKVRTALGLAREGGLVRETAACLAELGTLYSLSGRFDTSLQLHQEAVGLVAGTSFRLREVGYRVEAGRVAVRLGDLRQARNQLDAAEAVAARTEDPVGQARIHELRGQIFAREDKVPEAAAKLESALSTYQKRGHRADEARVATDLVSLWAGKDEGRTKTWSQRATKAFQAIGNTAGPAHVQVAAGLGYARRLDLDSALAAFLEAAELAEALETDRGRQIATHARENAAQALKALGHPDALADEMATATDLQGVMAQQAAFAIAERSYQKGLEGYNRGEYAAAYEDFDSAVKAFVKIGETGHANTSRKGRGWASRGLALRAEPSAALPRFESALRDATAAGDGELRAKAQVGAALSAADLERKDAAKRLTAAADVAERGGYKDEAGLCLARLAQVAESFGTRAAAARRAVDLGRASGRA
ncbi:MAG: hypothetical protein AB8H79_18775, partial [Myxococcota bacterium]